MRRCICPGELRTCWIAACHISVFGEFVFIFWVNEVSAFGEIVGSLREVGMGTSEGGVWLEALVAVLDNTSVGRTDERGV